MEAPEKIYFSGQQEWTNPFIGLTQKCADTGVEYTRTDSLIEKAKEYLQKHLIDYYSHVTDKKGFIENFVKFMKGE